MKTTATGIAMLFTALPGFLKVIYPEIPGPDLSTAITMAMAGLGLIFASDAKP